MLIAQPLMDRRADWDWSDHDEAMARRILAAPAAGFAADHDHATEQYAERLSLGRSPGIGDSTTTWKPSRLE